MIKKIAILTQPLGHNYGGIIQNYAIQKVLKERGCEVITIDRQANNPHSNLKIMASKYKSFIFRKLLHSKNPKYLEFNVLFKNNLQFIKDYINISPSLETTMSLSNFFKNEKFDAVIVGSDQVWRPKYSPNIYNFYLDFLKDETDIVKLAFAASFGTTEWEYTHEETANCLNLIQTFDAVSVREDFGIELCSQFLNYKDSVHVLDPTLLLISKDYDKLIRNKEKLRGMFTYVLDNSEIKNEFIKKCSEHLELNYFTNQAKSISDSFDTNDDITDFIAPPIEGWLQGFRDADFVITDSYHGTIFSIINQRPFISIVNMKRGASRFESLLKELGLLDRLVYNVEEFDINKLNQEIDYVQVNLKLEKLKDYSLKFLKKYI